MACRENGSVFKDPVELKAISREFGKQTILTCDGMKLCEYGQENKELSLFPKIFDVEALNCKCEPCAMACCISRSPLFLLLFFSFVIMRGLAGTMSPSAENVR